MNGYELSRNWFDFCFDNPEKIKPIHSAIFYFAVGHCNRLGWKEKFGFPSQMTMEALGIKNWRTYSKAFNNLVDWGFFIIIQRSKNQYSSNIISLSAYVKNTKALDKARSKHIQKHTTKQGQSTVSIIKQENKEQRTKKQVTKINIPTLSEWINFAFDYAKSYFDFPISEMKVKSLLTNSYEYWEAKKWKDVKDWKRTAQNKVRKENEKLKNWEEVKQQQKTTNYLTDKDGYLLIPFEDY